MFLTYFNQDTNVYEVKIPCDKLLCMRTECEELINDKIIMLPKKYFVSGFIVDALAEYESTGLTPDEIKILHGTLEKLRESNKILRKNNDDYYVAYQKLLDENYKLKSLLKNWLDNEN
jgi:FtsZ-binding cell division protein ZapB